MKNLTTTQAPQLAAPGAGLPKVELFFARRLVRWKARRTDRASAAATFAKERDGILRMMESFAPEQLMTQVLIKRLPGLEDSSRFWSVLMTVDHLRIVNQELAEIIAGLCAGQPPQRAVSTAAVKPNKNVDTSFIPAFAQVCREFEATVAAQKDLRTPLYHAHPWFGPMDAADWHFMAGFHMGLHRQQIERILVGL